MSVGKYVVRLDGALKDCTHLHWFPTGFCVLSFFLPSLFFSLSSFSSFFSCLFFFLSSFSLSSFSSLSPVLLPLFYSLFLKSSSAFLPLFYSLFLISSSAFLPFFLLFKFCLISLLRSPLLSYFLLLRPKRYFSVSLSAKTKCRFATTLL